MQMSGFVALLVAVVVGRLLNERAYRTLGSEEKLRLMDGFSKTRAYSMIPLLVLIGGYWCLATQTSLNKLTLSVVYFVLLIVYVVVRSVWNQVKLAQLGMPADYQRKFTITQVVSLLGIAWFLSLIHISEPTRPY